MGKLRQIVGRIVILFTIATIGGCEEYFEYSPYAANVKESYKGTFNENLNYLKASDTTDKGIVKIAIIADSHYNYHELNEAIVNINSREDIDFVIANGDITDHGYLKEYELFHDQMQRLKFPYFTVIGNHDYRSNGGKIYKSMYGEFNKQFSYNNNLIILFDDVFWESNSIPDFNWLESSLLQSTEYENVFVICHIPPYGSQFLDKDEELYKNLMIKYNVDLSVHGHIHRYEYGDYYNDGMKYLCVESIIDKEYGLITINQDSIVVESVKY